jgi:hypothetical protein
MAPRVLRNLRAGRLAVGGGDVRRENTRCLRDVDNATGAVAENFAERLKVGPLRRGGEGVLRCRMAGQ